MSKKVSSEIIVNRKGNKHKNVKTLSEINSPSLKKRKLETKKCLQTPYSIVWPTIEKEIQCEILQHISRCLSSVNLKKPKIAKGTKKEERSQSIKDQWNEKTTEELNLRSQLSIGMSKTMRLLERNELAIVLIDTATPVCLHKHILQLAAMKQKLAIGIRGISQKIAPILGLESVIALGIKKRKDTDSTLFDDLIEKLRPLIPEIIVPWKDYEYGIIESEAEVDEIIEDEDNELKVDVQVDTSINDNDIKVNNSKPLDFKHLYVMKSDLLDSNETDQFQDLGKYSFSNAMTTKLKTKDTKSGYVKVILEDRKYNPNRCKKYNKK